MPYVSGETWGIRLKMQVEQHLRRQFEEQVNRKAGDQKPQKSKKEQLTAMLSALFRLTEGPISLELLQEPVILTTCGHTFEKSQIDDCIASDSQVGQAQKNGCPTCHTAFAKPPATAYTKNILMHQVLNEVTAAFSDSDTAVDIDKFVSQWLEDLLVEESPIIATPTPAPAVAVDADEEDDDVEYDDVEENAAKGQIANGARIGEYRNGLFAQANNADGKTVDPDSVKSLNLPQVWLTNKLPDDKRPSPQLKIPEHVYIGMVVASSEEMFHLFDALRYLPTRRDGNMITFELNQRKFQIQLCQYNELVEFKNFDHLLCFGHCYDGTKLRDIKLAKFVHDYKKTMQAQQIDLDSRIEMSLKQYQTTQLALQPKQIMPLEDYAKLLQSCLVIATQAQPAPGLQARER